MRPDDIQNKSDNRSKRRAKTQHISAKLYKVEDNKVLYTVNSASGDKQYIVTIKLLNLTGNKLRSLKAALNGNIKINCTCPAFLYQGYKYISYKKDVGIEPENRSPDIRNPNKEGIACKHILVALEQMKNDYNAIYNMFKLQSPKQKAKPDKNKNSDELTETDIELLTSFKNACKELYNSYSEYNNSEIKDTTTFIDSEFYNKNDPSIILNDLSKPAVKGIRNMFIGKLTSIDKILNFIDVKKNGFNVQLDSDTSTAIKRINDYIGSVTESLINNIIFKLIME